MIGVPPHLQRRLNAWLFNKPAAVYTKISEGDNVQGMQPGNTGTPAMPALRVVEG